MTDRDASNADPDDPIRRRLRAVLSEHPVSFAMLFGSGARETMGEDSDVDVAVEFEALRPHDDGYSEVYLRLLSELDDALSTDVDLVDVHSASPEFAAVAFEEGEVIVGSETRREELRRELGESPSLGEARERVTAVAERLRERSS